MTGSTPVRSGGGMPHRINTILRLCCGRPAQDSRETRRASVRGYRRIGWRRETVRRRSLVRRDAVEVAHAVRGLTLFKVR